MSQFGKQLEKKIQGKLNAIEKGEADAKGSGVNDMIKKLKEIDEASADALQEKYIKVVKNTKKK
ncbi:MAG: hypothetical protein AABY15_06845 [Nanoarchaeota archaeon]